MAINLRLYLDSCFYHMRNHYYFDDKKVMIITSKIKNYDRDLIQITEINVVLEENSENLGYQFVKYQIIFCLLVILFIVGNILILISLLRFK